MVTEFKDMGGPSAFEIGAFQRWIQSMWLRNICSEKRLLNKRKREDSSRAKEGQHHVVEFFYGASDPYSHLAAQTLCKLRERYSVHFKFNLVSQPIGDNSPEPEMLKKLNRVDCRSVAREYGLEFPDHESPLDPCLVNLANSILSAQSDENFIAIVSEVGHALWEGDGLRLEKLKAKFGGLDDGDLQSCIERGNARREKLGHYSEAMFYYGGEWYWGIDRLYHFEERLACLLAGEQPGMPICFPRPKIENGPLKDDGSLTLEFYPTLRSPYTSIIFERVVKLASDTGIALRVLPVLPMVMRGVPTTKNKGAYIFWDAAREARSAGVPFGKIYDPVGRPVRRCYSLYPWAAQQGKGLDLLGSFLKAVMSEGVNCNNDRGLRLVVERAGLNWSDARKYIGDSEWVQLLEDNRRKLYSLGIWGTPSFRLLDNKGVQKSAWWGQDRLWIVSREVQQLLSLRKK